MSEFQDSSSEFSEDSFEITSKPQPCHFSILKHLPEARRILEGQNYEQQITKCMYEHQLNNNPTMVVPKPTNTDQSALQNARLTKLQEVMFDHVNMKEKIQGLLGLAGINSNGKQFFGTLWSLYSTQVPSYARFGLKIRKNNFANVMMPINGINVVLGSRSGHDKIPSNIQNPTISNNNTIDFSLSKNAPDSVRFDSHFESGNLLYAYRRLEPFENDFDSNKTIETYDLILQNDVNTKGHNQWFYFKVYNAKSHNRIRFNIINFNKDESMFSYGIKPLVFSERDFNRHKVGWVRNGEKVNYFANKIKKENPCLSGKKSYYTLSFEYYFTETDTVYFAPSYPYTHTQLLKYYETIMLNKSLHHLVSLKLVSETVGRNSVNVLTIGCGNKPIKECKIVWVFGRQHPGEITASYMAQGIMEYLVSLYSSPPPGMEYLLNNIVFKVVPMINVDGTIHGNTRAELTGVDPNRMWKKPLKRLTPVISSLKKLIAENKENVSLVLDLHSHSKKLGCFFYGNTLLHDPKFTKIYPTLVCEGDERFELKNCRFRGGYETTARSVIFHDLAIPSIYTVECSLLGYMKNKRIQEYRVADYQQMGKRLIDCYLNLERSKMTKKEQDIIEEMMGRIPERDDVDSARSESSLSEDEYDEIIHRNKKKSSKVKKVKKCINESNPVLDNANIQNQDKMKKIEIPKYHIKRKNKGSNKHEAHKQNKNVTSKQSASQLPNVQKNKNNQTHSVLKENCNRSLVENLSAFQKKHNRKVNISAINKTIQHEKKGQESSSRNRIKTGVDIGSFTLEMRDVSTQVNFEENPMKTRYNRTGKNKNDILCIVGSSLEDEYVCAFKNDVATQVFGEVIKESVANMHKSSNKVEVNKKSSKNAKKIPKFFNYIASNLMDVKENAVYPQGEKKILAPIQANRKALNAKV